MYASVQNTASVAEPLCFYFCLYSSPFIFLLVMFLRLTGQAPIPSDWTVAPGKRILEGLEEIEDAPTNDDVVVETNKATHLQRERGRWMDGWMDK